MNAIGGYFGLEICDSGKHYHENAIQLNTARNCFEYIILSRGYKKVYIPYYTCEVMLEPIRKHAIEFEFYSINENLEPINIINLKKNEAFLYTNYFGLKQDYAQILAKIYKENLIIDNAQAFFAEPIPNIDTFYSARKFFGVSDGAYLYTDSVLEQKLEQDKSYERMSHLLKRIDLSAEEGYSDFILNDSSLQRNNIKHMSKLTESILKSINYDQAKKSRTDNFNYLHNILKKKNKLEFTNLDYDISPMNYPYFSTDLTLRKKLISNKIYIPTYWPNVLEWTTKEHWEYKLASCILSLPCDKRYSKTDYEYLIGQL